MSENMSFQVVRPIMGNTQRVKNMPFQVVGPVMGNTQKDKNIISFNSMGTANI